MANDESPEQTGNDLGLISVTIDPTTAQILTIERIDATGTRHALSAEDRANLLRRRAEKTLEELVERAFEAGIACILDGEKNLEEAEERNDSLEDVELTHRLLEPLIEHSAAKRLIARDTLDRAMLGTLISHAQTFAASTSGHTESGSP